MTRYYNRQYISAPIFNSGNNMFLNTTDIHIVATTHQNGTRSLLTSAKLSNGLSHNGDYKRTQQGALTILSTIYIHGSWSVLQQYLSSVVDSKP